MGWLDRILSPHRPSDGRVVPLATVPEETRVARGPVHLSQGNLDRFLVDHPRAVVDVWAPWCGPCRGFAPVFLAASKQWGGSVGFGKIHADRESGLVRQFNVRSIPSLLFFRDGRLVRTEVGALPPDRFERRLRAVFRDLQ